MTKKQLTDALDGFSQFEHVVFRLSGENPMEFIQLLSIYGLLPKFGQRKYSASFWTMDSHHLGQQEAKASQHFDRVFVAHENYMSLFSKVAAHHLPCSFSLTPDLDVAEYLKGATKVENATTGGVCAPFAAYPWQERNRLYLEGLLATREIGVESFFGTVRGGKRPNEALIRKILSYRVVLNLSLYDDLNMRNFEALALNRVLLTNKVEGHHLLEDFSSNVVYLDSKNLNIKGAVLRALELQPQDISKAFLTKHSINVRVKEMVGILLNVDKIDLVTGIARAQVIPIPKKSGSSQTSVEREHKPEVLLARSGYPDSRQFRRLILASDSPAKSAVVFISSWLGSLLTYSLARLIRKAAVFRPSIRAMASLLKH
jgi:hypothetical protein